MVAPLTACSVEDILAMFAQRQRLERLLLACPETQDLLRSNPVLAFMLAHCDGFRRQTPLGPLRHAGFMVSRKQKEILGWLGFPPTESTVRLFRKIRPEAATVGSLRLLREALGRDPEVPRLLAHQRVVNTGILAIASRSRLHPLAAPRLLLEIGESAEELQASPTADLLLDTLRMFEQVLFLPMRRPLHSIAAVRRIHDDASQKCIAMVKRRTRPCYIPLRRRFAPPFRTWKREPWRDPFPAPPLPGTEHIVPITSDRDLVEEAAQQHNCVASYAIRVRTEPLYLYRVLQPERATLCIRRSDVGVWQIQELKLNRNKLPQDDTRAVVEKWLNNCQAPRKRGPGRNQAAPRRRR